MKTILIPIDFSPASINAFQYGVSLAATTHARVILLHVYAPTGFEPMVPVSMQHALMDAKHDLALAHFAEIENNIDDELLKQVDLDIKILVGPVVEQILWTCEDLHVDLMVLGRAEDRNVLQRFLGSTATKVVQLASCPVLIVPESASFQGFKRIAYGTNFESADIKAIDQVLRLARDHQAKVYCVHIQQGKQKVNAFKQSILQEAYQHEWTMHQLFFETVDHDSVNEGLTEYLVGNEMDLLVMLTHKRSILSQLFYSSQTKQIARKSSIPILAIQMTKSASEVKDQKRATA